MKGYKIKRLGVALLILLLPVSGVAIAEAKGRIVYLVSDLRIPFWEIMWRGAKHQADALNYQITVYSADNEARKELQFTVQAIREKVDGIVLSPTNSSAAVSVLKLAGKAGIPVVIADIGAESGDYISYIASDNREGSYQLGQMLASALKQKGWGDGTVGIVAIPQKRANGRARTDGFMQALAESGIKGGGLKQQVDFSYQETYDLSRQLITQDPQLRAIWLQGSDRYQAALDAISDAGREGEVLLICFDAEPEFIDMISSGVLVGSGMQQPFLMGETAVGHLVEHLQGKAVPKDVLLPVLPVSRRDLQDDLPKIRRNVLGLDVIGR